MALGRIHKELRLLENLPDEIVELCPDSPNNDLFHLTAKIKGPVGTPYENGIFTLNIVVPENYPYKPPKVTFQTKIFHPNINSKGNICLDIFDYQWSPTFTLEKTILSICSLLDGPYTGDFLVPEAAYLYKHNRDEFNKKAKEWTEKYANQSDQTAEIDELVTEVNTINLPTSPDIVLHSEGRVERFIGSQSLQKKIFDYGESKEYVPLVAQCFSSLNNDNNQKNRFNLVRMHVKNFDVDQIEGFIDEEINSIIEQLENEKYSATQLTEIQTLIDNFCRLIVLTPDEIAQGCFDIYARDILFCHYLQRFLGEQDDSQVLKYGSFVRLLYFSFHRSWTQEIHGIEVYRGGNLTQNTITSYKTAREHGTTFRWVSFTSTTRNLEFVKTFDTNTIFIIRLNKIYEDDKKAIDISPFSDYPNEEEILLKPGVEFTVGKVIENEDDRKFYIHLNAYV